MSKSKKEKSFSEYLKEIEHPNYPWINKDLPENPTNLEKAKFEVCQQILIYQEDNKLTDEAIAKKLGISKEETLPILFSHIEKFTLDSLIIYTNKLFSPQQVEIIVRSTKPKTEHARV